MKLLLSITVSMSIVLSAPLAFSAEEPADDELVLANPFQKQLARNLHARALRNGYNCSLASARQDHPLLCGIYKKTLRNAVQETTALLLIQFTT